jgi:predicted ATPase
MKIDIHTHTKKIKTGDAETRNIEPSRFNEIIRNTDVKILAITNHNHFDKAQYQEINEMVKDVCQIWPGIEIDVLQGEQKAHLLVIANPKSASEFESKCNEILGTTSPNIFNASIQNVVDTFGDLDCIYIAHYYTKTPNFRDEDIELLSSLISNPKRIIKEATNSLSVGIYISHGHNSIYGSDVQNWDTYEQDSANLPELRLPVDSFEQFCLLLEKDEPTINSLLGQKPKDNLVIYPFENMAESIELEIFNDINIIFGSKGTGKTDILTALSNHYKGLGHATSVYKSNDQHLDVVFDLKGLSFNCDVSEFEIDNCENEIEFLKSVVEVDVTSLTRYSQHFSELETNKKSQLLKIRSITNEDEASPNRKVNDIKNFIELLHDFIEEFVDQDKIKNYVNVDLLSTLADLLDSISTQLKNNLDEKFNDAKSIKLLNQIVTKINLEISKNTGIPEKPTVTGFAEFARKRIQIEIATKKIATAIFTEISPIDEYAGSLGPKGELYCRTSLKIHDGNFSKGSYSTVTGINKTPQRDFSSTIDKILKNIYSNDLFEKIAELTSIEGIEQILTVSDLLQFRRHFLLEGKEYKPSTGESSMILLHKELFEDKPIYIIDEPEKSLGNDYISDVIVPFLKEKALVGKKIIIATHDANIAVRTLPYNSIYRLRENGLNYTLTGNPFSNKLKCVTKTHGDLDWKEISMKTLEGGKSAFGERSKIYGN